MAYEILRGVLGGIGGARERRRLEEEPAREEERLRARQILEAVMKGTIEPTERPEEALFRGPRREVAPPDIKSRIMEGFGLRRPQYEPGQGYRRVPEVPGKYEPTTQEEALKFERAKAGIKATGQPTVKVIGNSLVKYNPTTGETTPIYTAPTNKQIKQVGFTGRIIEYDPKTGKIRELYNEMGEPVFEEETPSEKQVDVRKEYNRLRSQGVSAEEAKRQLGIR